MASLVVAWSVKNVLCAIVCMVALTWSGPRRSEDSSLQDFLDSLNEPDEGSRIAVEHIESWMEPSFTALPSHNQRLQTLAAKHLLHSYLNEEFGLTIQGLQFYNSQREPDAKALEELPLLRRAPRLKAALQDAPYGFALRELASLAVVFKRLVLREVRAAFKVAWRLRNHSVGAELSGEELHEVFCAGLIVAHDWDQVIINSESLKKGASGVYHERFRIGQDFSKGNVLTWLSLKQHVVRVSRETLRPAAYYSFKTALPTFLSLFMAYGSFQNSQCRDMKGQMRSQDPDGLGRILLKDDQKVNWHRKHPSLVGYLQKLEAVTSFFPQSPTIIVTNYLESSQNCISGNANFALCCISECQGVLRLYETHVKAPYATADALLEITDLLPGANLTKELVSRLHSISQITGGYVHLHGLLFAEWLHVLMPYQCPWPSPRWSKDDRADMYLNNPAIGAREVPVESWFSESMKDLHRLLDDGLDQSMPWGEEEVLPLDEEAPEILETTCRRTSTFHMVVQVVVILAGMNDLIWLFQWWQWPQGRSKASEKSEKDSKSLPIKGATKKDPRPKKGKSLKGPGREKCTRAPPADDRVEADGRKEEEPDAEDSEEEANDVQLISGELGCAMSKAAARVATSRAAAAAAVAAVTELQAATVPEARSILGLGALFRSSRSSIRRQDPA